MQVSRDLTLTQNLDPTFFLKKYVRQVKVERIECLTEIVRENQESIHFQKRYWLRNSRKICQFYVDHMKNERSIIKQDFDSFIMHY